MEAVPRKEVAEIMASIEAWIHSSIEGEADEDIFHDSKQEILSSYQRMSDESETPKETPDDSGMTYLFTVDKKFDIFILNNNLPHWMMSKLASNLVEPTENRQLNIPEGARKAGVLKYILILPFEGSELKRTLGMAGFDGIITVAMLLSNGDRYHVIGVQYQGRPIKKSDIQAIGPLSRRVADMITEHYLTVPVPAPAIPQEISELISRLSHRNFTRQDGSQLIEAIGKIGDDNVFREAVSQLLPLLWDPGNKSEMPLGVLERAPQIAKRFWNVFGSSMTEDQRRNLRTTPWKTGWQLPIPWDPVLRIKTRPQSRKTVKLSRVLPA